MRRPQSRQCEECHRQYLARRNHRPSRFCSRSCANRVTARTRATTKGYVVTAKGYIAEYRPGHPMAMRSGYLLQHRRVMADHLGRMLTANEVVDHLNGIKNDNRPMNLRVMTKQAHDETSNRGRLRRARCPKCQHRFLLRGRVDSAGVLSDPSILNPA